MGIIRVDLDKSNLDDNKNPFEDHPETIHVKLSPCYNKFEKHKSCKKEISKELKPAAWHSR